MMPKRKPNIDPNPNRDRNPSPNANASLTGIQTIGTLGKIRTGVRVRVRVKVRILLLGGYEILVGNTSSDDESDRALSWLGLGTGVGRGTGGGKGGDRSGRCPKQGRCREE